MKFYTVQTINAYRELKIKGYLTGNKKFINENWFLNSYLWMMEQMAKRIKNYNNEFPIWLWLDTTNICFNELLNNKYVLLEVELDEDQVLLSNFEAWHYVLNGWSFEEKNNNISKEQSWEYIFDKNKMKQFGYGFEKDDLQGTVSKISYTDIKPVRHIYNNA